MPTTHRLARVLALTLAVPAARGQIDPRANEIITESVQALFAAGHTDVQSVSARASCIAPDGPYTLEAHWIRDRGVRVSFGNADGAAEATALITEDGARWLGNDDQPGAELTHDEREVMLLHHFQLVALDPKSYFEQPTLVAERRFAGASCHELAFASQGEPVGATFFHADTHLLAGYTHELGRFADNPITTRFIEWREVEGVLLPAKVLVTDTRGDYVLTFSELRVDQTPADLFPDLAEP